MLLILITSQIVNLKMVGVVLGLKKCYQCGGETLVPVVKHSVSDGNMKLSSLRGGEVASLMRTLFVGNNSRKPICSLMSFDFPAHLSFRHGKDDH
jgi:hypothetical protein